MAQDPKKQQDPFETYLAELETEQEAPTPIGAFAKRIGENAAGIPQGILQMLQLASGSPEKWGEVGSRVAQNPRGPLAGIVDETVFPVSRTLDDFQEGNYGGIAGDVATMLGLGRLGKKAGFNVKPKLNKNGLPANLGPDAVAGPKVSVSPEVAARQASGDAFARGLPELGPEYWASKGIENPVLQKTGPTPPLPDIMAGVEPYKGGVGQLSSSKIGDAILRGQSGRLGFELQKSLNQPRELGGPRLVKVPDTNNPLVGPQNFPSMLSSILGELAGEGGIGTPTRGALDFGQTRLLGGKTVKRDYGTLARKVDGTDHPLSKNKPEASKVSDGIKGKDPKKRQSKKRKIEDDIVIK